MLNFKSILLNVKSLWVLYILAGMLVSIHLFTLGPKAFNGIENYTHYNNYVIFKQAFFHLIHQQDLYIEHVADQYDLFKYSPAFALFMAPFAVLPDLPGLILWNVLNAILVILALSRVPQMTDKFRVFAMWFLLQETITGLQSAQTNPMIAGLLMLAFVSFERNKVIWASLFIVLTVFIKIFGMVAFLLFFLYPEKVKFVLWSILWTILLIFIPLIAVPFEQLIFLYKSWWNMLQNDHSVSYGLSVMGWLKTWFGLEPNKMLVVLTGAVLLMLPLIKTKEYYHYGFRMVYMSMILIWVIIFNHKAESSTFVIALSGITMWYFTMEKNSLMHGLIIFAFVFTCLSPTDLFPRFIRNDIIAPYVLKAVPCIFIWFYMLYQMMFNRFKLRVD